MRAKLILMLIVPVLAFSSCKPREEKEYTVFPKNSEKQERQWQLDLRVDANRDGKVDLTGDSDANEDAFTADSGAIFLANIDDDESACKVTQDMRDEQLALCNDAADEVINGPKDLLDMARVHLLPLKGLSEDTTATIVIEPANKVRLFWLDGSSLLGQVVKSGRFVMSADMLQKGLEFALEGKDVIRDSSWDGLVKITASYTSGIQDASLTDSVVLKEAPIILSHHLNAPRVLYAADVGGYNQDMLDDLAVAVDEAGVPGGLKLIELESVWMQDVFEFATMSMPGPDGPHVIETYLRSAAFYDNFEHPRYDSQIVFTVFRGPDRAGVEAYKTNRSMDEEDMDSLNSTGNLEAVPPYTFKGKSYPLGRIVTGSTPTFYVDTVFMTMLEAQKAQPPIKLDTSWLAVGHVDEVLSVTKMDNARGWGLLLNDPRLAKKMLEDLQKEGHGDVKMFVGCTNDVLQDACVTINEVLDDEDVMEASQEAAIYIDGMLEVLKEETGIEDNEIILVPFLHTYVYNASIAYMPGTVNGISMGDGHYAAPKVHGPVINGVDPFQKNLEDSLAEIDVSVHWVEDFTSYHERMGEIHCGSNMVREAGTAERWWEKK